MISKTRSSHSVWDGIPWNALAVFLMGAVVIIITTPRYFRADDAISLLLFKQNSWWALLSPSVRLEKMVGFYRPVSVLLGLPIYYLVGPNYVALHYGAGAFFIASLCLFFFFVRSVFEERVALLAVLLLHAVFNFTMYYFLQWGGAIVLSSTSFFICAALYSLNRALIKPKYVPIFVALSIAAYFSHPICQVVIPSVGLIYVLMYGRKEQRVHRPLIVVCILLLLLALLLLFVVRTEGLHAESILGATVNRPTPISTFIQTLIRQVSWYLEVLIAGPNGAIIFLGGILAVARQARKQWPLRASHIFIILAILALPGLFIVSWGTPTFLKAFLLLAALVLSVVLSGFELSFAFIWFLAGIGPYLLVFFDHSASFWLVPGYGLSIILAVGYSELWDRVTSLLGTHLNLRMRQSLGFILSMAMLPAMLLAVLVALDVSAPYGKIPIIGPRLEQLRYLNSILAVNKTGIEYLVGNAPYGSLIYVLPDQSREESMNSSFEQNLQRQRGMSVSRLQVMFQYLDRPDLAVVTAGGKQMSEGKPGYLYAMNGLEISEAESTFTLRRVLEIQEGAATGAVYKVERGQP